MFWNPVDGTTKQVSYEIKDGRTYVQLDFESWDAFFITFLEPSSVDSFDPFARSESPILDLSNGWNVDFGEFEREYMSLEGWEKSDSPQIKYFSGIATYSKSFTIGGKESNAQYYLDLGEVKNLAEIWVNGQKVGTVWKTPFRLEVTQALKSGVNQVEIRVANTWVNRLIGDAQDGAVKTTFTTMQFYQKNSQLVPSGLLGPVKIQVKK